MKAAVTLRNQGLPPSNLGLPRLLQNQPIWKPWATFLHREATRPPGPTEASGRLP